MDNKDTFMAGLMALIVVMGVPIANRNYNDVFNEELKNYYVCSINENIIQFNGGISGTAYSGYPLFGSRANPVYCGNSANKGKWILIKEYAVKQGLDPYELIKKSNNNIPSPSQGDKRWLCSINGCVKLWV